MARAVIAAPVTAASLPAIVAMAAAAPSSALASRVAVVTITSADAFLAEFAVATRDDALDALAKAGTYDEVKQLLGSDDDDSWLSALYGEFVAARDADTREAGLWPLDDDELAELDKVFIRAVYDVLKKRIAAQYGIPTGALALAARAAMRAVEADYADVLEPDRASELRAKVTAYNNVRHLSATAPSPRRPAWLGRNHGPQRRAVPLAARRPTRVSRRRVRARSSSTRTSRGSPGRPGEDPPRPNDDGEEAAPS